MGIFNMFFAISPPFLSFLQAPSLLILVSEGGDLMFVET